MSSSQHLLNALSEVVALQDVLAEEARTLIDEFSDERASLSEKFISEKTKAARYFPRVQTIKKSPGLFYIQWRDYTEKIKARYFNGGDPNKQVPLPAKYGDHVRPNKKGEYTIRAFGNAPGWEKELILDYEEKFQVIREKSRRNAEIIRRIKFAINYIEKTES